MTYGPNMRRFELLAPFEWLDRIDAWRVTQPGIPSRAEAIRTLVDQALDAGKVVKKRKR